jgi:hypothetical protein
MYSPGYQRYDGCESHASKWKSQARRKWGCDTTGHEACDASAFWRIQAEVVTAYHRAACASMPIAIGQYMKRSGIDAKTQ